MVDEALRIGTPNGSIAAGSATRTTRDPDPGDIKNIGVMRTEVGGRTVTRRRRLRRSIGRISGWSSAKRGRKATTGGPESCTRVDGINGRLDGVDGRFVRIANDVQETRVGFAADEQFEAPQGPPPHRLGPRRPARPIVPGEAPGAIPRRR